MSEVRLEVYVIELKVLIGLFLFNKVVIEKEEREAKEYVNELKKWAKSKNIMLKVEYIRRPLYIRGHTVYLTEGTIPYILMTFSK